VLDLVSSVLSQEIGWEERSRKMAYFVSMRRKTLINQSGPSSIFFIKINKSFNAGSHKRSRLTRCNIFAYAQKLANNQLNLRNGRPTKSGKAKKKYKPFGIAMPCGLKIKPNCLLARQSLPYTYTAVIMTPVLI